MPPTLPTLSPRVIRALDDQHQGDYLFQRATDSDTGQRAWRSLCSCGHPTPPARSMAEAIRDQGNHRAAIFTGARVRLSELDAGAHVRPSTEPAFTVNRVLTVK